MYATIYRGVVYYLGEEKTQAEYQATRPHFDKGEFKVVEVHSLGDLVAAMNPHETFADKAKQQFKDAFSEVTSKLDQIGVNEELFKKIQNQSETLIDEAKVLGVRGMEAVGAGFSALGKLMRGDSK